MSDTFDHSGLPEDELLAAEYALGVLDGIDRAAAERRVARDRGFARQVASWEQRLAPWAAEIPEMLPPPHVWDRIAGALPSHAPRFGLCDLATILEGIADGIAGSRNPIMLAEHVRARLLRQLCARHTSPGGYLPLAALSAKWEQAFAESMVRATTGSSPCSPRACPSSLPLSASASRKRRAKAKRPCW